jgi:hypothetical protein
MAAISGIQKSYLVRFAVTNTDFASESFLVITLRITGANVVSLPVHAVVQLSFVVPVACIERYAYYVGPVGEARTPL